jgi:PEGA domain
VKKAVVLALLLLSGCGWFHRKPPAPPPTELIVTGAPAGATLLVDGVQSGQVAEANNRTQILPVTSGNHVLEVKVGDSTTYSEQVYVAPGEKHVVSVLSGFSR